MGEMFINEIIKDPKKLGSFLIIFKDTGRNVDHKKFTFLSVVMLP